MAKKVKIENDLYEKLKKCAEAAGYSSTDEFVIHVLEKPVQDIDTSDEEEKVKEKLRGLGYLS